LSIEDDDLAGADLDTLAREGLEPAQLERHDVPPGGKRRRIVSSDLICDEDDGLPQHVGRNGHGDTGQRGARGVSDPTRKAAGNSLGPAG
jgi:hypothetical protein